MKKLSSNEKVEMPLHDMQKKKIKNKNIMPEYCKAARKKLTPVKLYLFELKNPRLNRQKNKNNHKRETS